MAKYFTFTQGLRGCYMPDNEPAVIMVRTRKELKAFIEDEARAIRDSGYLGCSKKNVAAFAAICWREAQKQKPAALPYALPYGERPYKAGLNVNYSHGLFLSVASRREFLDYAKEQENN